jgi:16S rRNA (guanine527-N7)-methyltransferase
VRSEFIQALRSHQATFGISLDDKAVESLADYFKLIQTDNPLLHLVAPCSPEEFAIRHILESLMLTEYLSNGGRFADVGTGAGLPALPCLIVREDVAAVLIESKQKKASFLNSAIRALRLTERSTVVNKQFEEVTQKEFDLVTCRALDKFSDKLPRLLKWANRRKIVLFGGPNLRQSLDKQKVAIKERLIPMSEQRYIFIKDN